MIGLISTRRGPGAGGSIIDLAQKYFDLDYPKAMFMLRKMLARYEY